MKNTRIIAQANIEVPDSCRNLDIRLSKNKELPGFYMIGNNKRGSIKDKFMKTNTVDAVDLLLSLTSVEKYAFKILYNHFQPVYDEYTGKTYTTTILHVKTGSLKQSDKVRFSKGFKGLVLKRIAIRTKREHYQLNPYMFIPTNFINEERKWNQTIQG